ncbi:MAG: response regulator transcription factor [Acidobacteriota bacterium]|nr:response regulator transcription factor [Acidobacteriota bacterium]
MAEAADSDAALVVCRDRDPNLVLMDVRLPGRGGSDACALLLREFPRLRVLMLSTQSNPEEINRALQSGASGYVLKTAQRDDLLRAIREVWDGRAYIDPAVTALLASRTWQRSLTTREVEVHASRRTGWAIKKWRLR